MESLRGPWPWYIVGPLIGAMVPLLLVAGNRSFGVSSSLRHRCAMTLPAGLAYFTCNWRRDGACPGPLVAQIGAGASVMIVAAIAAVAGTWTYGWMRPYLPH